ncbi:hypothetical protein PCH_Pc13g08590 [Penicillium rubens Wisconsin 54-1255]|uniref:Uncharacterized protein n=1 Tax=Penicillium rubens (strain ATCC 28089 / DSM 1075 / NRRL 1951 / Wisconsin 54-1255) TaxID=500485 RepID=B6H4E4_PENRW|nr:hypothetical protein PCH_Pc13g08590 [Penicillium rubens Wisconsin 54-1255]
MTWFVLYAVSDAASVQVFVVVVIHNTAFPIPENPEKQAWPMSLRKRNPGAADAQSVPGIVDASVFRHRRLGRQIVLGARSLPPQYNSLRSASLALRSSVVRPINKRSLIGKWDLLAQQSLCRLASYA